MTPVTFVFLTLFTWIVSSRSWLCLDPCTELSQSGHDEETRGFSPNGSHTKALLCGKTQFQTCDRSPGMYLVWVVYQDRMTNDCRLSSCVIVNVTVFIGCETKLLRVKEAMDGDYGCKRKIQKIWEYFSSGAKCFIKINVDNHDTHWIYRTINASSVLLRSIPPCSHIIIFALVDHFKTVDCIYIYMKKIQQRCLLCDETPEFSTLFEKQRMPAKFYPTQRSKGAVLTQSDAIIFPPYTENSKTVESVQPIEASRWVGRYLMASVFTLGICIARIKMSTNTVNPAHVCKYTTVLLLTLTLYCFSASVNTSLTSNWSCITVGIPFVVCLCCALGRAVHGLSACRAVHNVIKLFCPTKRQFIVLPVTVIFLWFTIPLIPNTCVKHCFESIIFECDIGSRLRSWAVFGQTELLATLYCALVSHRLLHSFLTELNLLSVFLHVQLVTYLPNSGVPIKYTLVIKINRSV